MQGFRKLDVYQCGLKALPLAYGLAKRADPEMKKQLRRAALSINLNIAEGSGRRDADQKHFYRVARGSALECAAVLDALCVLGLATETDCSELERLLDRVVAMLTRMVL